MLTLLHISDLHFGPHYLPRVGEAALRSAETLSADIVVASGDFTQRAKPRQFADARAFLDRLPSAPLVVVPGNHDVPLYRVVERLFSPYALYRRHIKDELDYVVRHERAVIAALNSTHPLRAITNGRIRAEHLELCDRAFTEAPADAVRIVVAHHHFTPAPDYEKANAMPGAKRALERFAQLRVDLVLGGHLHRGYIGNSLDVHAGTDREHGAIVVQCGTTTSRRGRGREREKNSFNLIRVDEAAVRVTHYMYFDDAAGFAPIGYHMFPRARRKYFAAPLQSDPFTGPGDGR